MIFGYSKDRLDKFYFLLWKSVIFTKFKKRYFVLKILLLLGITLRAFPPLTWLTVHWRLSVIRNRGNWDPSWKMTFSFCWKIKISREFWVRLARYAQSTSQTLQRRIGLPRKGFWKNRKNVIIGTKSFFFKTNYENEKSWRFPNRSKTLM